MVISSLWGNRKDLKAYTKLSFILIIFNLPCKMIMSLEEDSCAIIPTPFFTYSSLEILQTIHMFDQIMIPLYHCADEMISQYEQI